MPVAVMVHFIWQAIIMGMPIIGIPPIGIMPPAIIGFIIPPIMGIGIICIAVFIYFLQVGWKEIPSLSDNVDKRIFLMRQYWNFCSFVFLQQDDRSPRDSDGFAQYSR
jgi:hypothetical protein